MSNNLFTDVGHCNKLDKLKEAYYSRSPDPFIEHLSSFLRQILSSVRRLEKFSKNTYFVNR